MSFTAPPVFSPRPIAAGAGMGVDSGLPVDGHFDRAGYDAGDIHECHGSIHHLQCLDQCSDSSWPADDVMPDIDETQCRFRGALPRCPQCGGLARPNVLMFNDWEWNDRRYQVQAARQTAWLASASRPVIVEIGAGSAVASVRNFSEHLIRRHGARLIRINPREPGVQSPRDAGLAMPALAGLTAIDTIVSLGWRGERG
jgi:NAD-dependent SIR2 family protein deacetylase